MATLIFAQAKTIRRKCRDAVRLHERVESGVDPNTVIDRIIEAERTEFREIMRIAALLHEDYQEITGATARNWYFVTVRPKPGVTFEHFYSLTHKYVNRAFMKMYKLTFEQKSVEGNGDGFHIHMICSTRHRSKGELLRDTQNTFASVCDANCIDVKPTRNAEEMFTKYCIEYESDDNHKIATKNGDAIWRTKMNLADHYDNDLPKGIPLLSSSPGQERNTSTLINFD